MPWELDLIGAMDDERRKLLIAIMGGGDIVHEEVATPELIRGTFVRKGGS